MNPWLIRRAKPAASQPSNRQRRPVCTNEQLIKRFDTFLLVSGKAERTRLNYAEALRQLDRFLKGQALTTVKTRDIRAFFGHLFSRNVQPATIATRKFALKVFFYRFLKFDRRLDIAVPRVVLAIKPPHVKSEAEIERLIAAADNPRDRAIIELGYASGLRASELVNLKVDDLRLDVLSLTARQGKGGNDRVAPFGRKAAQALREYLGTRTTGYVFEPMPKERKNGPRAARAWRDRYAIWRGVWRDRYGVWCGAWRERTPDGTVVMQTVRLGDYELPTRKHARDALDAFLAGNPKVGVGRVTRKEFAAVNRRLSTRQLSRIVARIAKRAGLEGVHPHVLRHSCATHCLKRGMNILGVMEMLGHTSPVPTQKYLHLDFADLKRIHAQFHPHSDSKERHATK